MSRALMREEIGPPVEYSAASLKAAAAGVPPRATTTTSDPNASRRGRSPSSNTTLVDAPKHPDRRDAVNGSSGRRKTESKYAELVLDAARFERRRPRDATVAV